MLDAAVAQPFEIAGGIGEAVGVVDAQSLDEAVIDELEDLPVRLLEDLGILDADAGELADVEEAAVPARLGVDVEELQP